MIHDTRSDYETKDDKKAQGTTVKRSSFEGGLNFLHRHKAVGKIYLSMFNVCRLPTSNRYKIEHILVL